MARVAHKTSPSKCMPRDHVIDTLAPLGQHWQMHQSNYYFLDQCQSPAPPLLVDGAPTYFYRVQVVSTESLNVSYSVARKTLTKSSIYQPSSPLPAKPLQSMPPKEKQVTSWRAHHKVLPITELVLVLLDGRAWLE